MDKEIIIDGKKIFYCVHGNGKPVMLVHGFGETGDVWTNQIEGPPQTPPKEGLTEDSLLYDEFKFIIPDLPGSGKSEMTEDMSIEGMAEVLKIILDTEFSKVPPSGGFRGACIIGHSMGGYITLAFAEKYNNYLTAFGLFHSTGYPDTEEKKITRRKGIEFIRQHGAFEFLETTSPNLFASATKQQSPSLVSQFIERLDKFSPAALIAYYEAMINRPGRVDILKNAAIPVLFVMGEQDNAIPMQDVLQQCHLPRQSSIHILHQSGHMGMLEEKEKANHILWQFLSGI
jgi:pimeloyl-ACP methyl ester carboxylesterase